MCGFPACTCAPFRTQQCLWACSAATGAVCVVAFLGIWLAARKPSTDIAALCNSLWLVGKDVCLSFACLS